MQERPLRPSTSDILREKAVVLHQKFSERGGGMAQVVQHLSRSSNPSTTKKKFSK
jgi:hypothetical protein